MQMLNTTDRAAIASYALRWNGWGDGSGYPGKANNPACKYVGHGLEYSCADGVTMNFGKAGFPLRSLQPGMAEGYDNCIEAYVWGHQHGAVINSWHARVGDVILVHTGTGAQPGHTELIYKVTGDGDHREIWTIGWDSGPSNVDGHGGQGGVHLHVWSTPVGGNPSIMAVLDADKLVDWSKVTRRTVHHHKKLKPAPLRKDTANKVTVLDRRLANRGRPVAGHGDRKLLHRLIKVAQQALSRKP